jgi:hypothetical protein
MDDTIMTFFLQKGTKFRPLQKYIASKLLHNSALNAEIRETSLTKQSAIKQK